MKYHLIGASVADSYSPLVHSFMSTEYDALSLDISSATKFVKSGEYSGLNVTSPYKKMVLPLLDEIETAAKSVGAVNTIKVENGKKSGYNTDIEGFLYAVGRRGYSLFGKSVLILGSGDTKDTITYACRKSGAKSVEFVSRSGKVNYENCYQLKDTQVLINATPVGSKARFFDQTVTLEKFDNLEFVFDCGYNPLRSPLIIKAKRLGISVGYGLDMLVCQAVRSEDIWFDRKTPLEEIDALIEKVRKKVLNICLIGMPSSGKTTVGERLSEKLCKPFIDTDRLFFEREGISPEDYIVKFGESSFRIAENRLIEGLLGVNGSVIASGGGSLLNDRNAQILTSNAMTVCLERDLDKLDERFRPLSAAYGVKKLYDQRRPVYQTNADAVVSNDGKIEDTVMEIIKAYEDFSR